MKSCFISIYKSIHDKENTAVYNMGMRGTKWVLFNKSVDLFAHMGYGTVSIRDIAGAAGIKASSVYNHFSSKEEILHTIYNFYNYYYSYFMPTLEELLDYVGKEPPRQTLNRALFRFDPSIQDTMDKIFLIASMQLYCDVRAQDMIFKNLYELSEKYLSALLNSMIDKSLIKPLDISAFILTMTSLCHSASLRMRTNYPIEWEVWVRSVDALFSQIIEV